MSKSYQQTNELDAMIAKLIEEKPYHKDLHVTGATVQVLFYHGGDIAPLTHRGVTCFACIELVPLKYRTLGLLDATIIIDWEQWKTMDELRQIALVDHELYHLQIKKLKDGSNATDDLGRPKMFMRPHDIEIGWFVEIAKEHKEASIEVMQATSMATTYRQQLFRFALKNGKA